MISANITTSITFPRVGDVAASDGKYYYNFGSGYGVNYASQTMTIKQPVVFIMTNHNGINAISTSSSATFTYGTGDSGANLFANKAPINTAIYGTNPTGQTFVTRGGGTFYGTIIAENGNITFDSGTNLMGGFCCNNMTLLGGVNFHYDESLGLVGGGGYKVTKWKELQSASERAAYAAALNF